MGEPTLHFLCGKGPLLAALLLAAAVSACGERPAAPAATAPAAAASAPAAPSGDRWLGQWTGPEGTFLKLTGGQGRYEVTIRNLDGPRTFAGSAAAGGIAFERDGSKETLHATDGAGTGMKWLAEKKDCLALRPGEGWCRD